MLYLVSKNIEVQKKVRESLKDNNMESEYVKGTVRETLRLYPPATFIGRILDEDGVIGSYQIPKGVSFEKENLFFMKKY